MSIAITGEQRAIQESIANAAARAGIMRTVRELESLESTGWRRHWADLADIGLLSIALPEDVGGAGSGLDDQCAALEQAAYELVPGPVLSTVLAGVLLARKPDTVTAKELLPGLADGTVTAAVGLDAGTLEALPIDGGMLVSGEVEVVLGADTDAQLLLSANGLDTEVWFAVAPAQPGVAVTVLPGTDFSGPLGRVVLNQVPVRTDRQLPDLSRSIVTDLAATLFAAQAAGVARWCVDTAVGHAKVREQFGRPIGSFQAIKHLCAELLCRAEQAGAVAWDAARAYDDAASNEPRWRSASDQHRLAAAVAAAVALDAAVDNAKDCVQVLGGIGYTWEHDAHLFLRRAVALRQLLGGTGRWRRRAAELVLGGTRRELRVRSDGGAGEERGAVRAFSDQLTGLEPDEQRVRLADSGYLVPHWPRPYGMDASPHTQLIVDDELARAGVRRPDLVIGGWAAPTILRHGSAAQQERFVRPTLRGEITWCQLFSEPGAGSDLAALRTRAVRADGGWRLDGQKVWSSRANEADWAICLARTDPDVSQHKGITYFLVDMRGQGIEIRPLRDITGEARFNEVFLDDVFVPDECVVGEVNGGWRLARTTLANERVAMSGGSSLGDAVEQLLELAASCGLTRDSATTERLGALVAQELAVSLVDVRATIRQLDGQDPGPESSVRKLIGVRHRQAVAEAALDLIGPAGAVRDGLGSELLHEFLLSRCLSIAGGTTQILLNLVGERILGLPRS